MWSGVQKSYALKNTPYYNSSTTEKGEEIELQRSDISTWLWH
jgi:hypothetical protein